MIKVSPGETPFRISLWSIWIFYTLAILLLLGGLFTDREIGSMIPGPDDMEEVYAALWLTSWTSAWVLALSLLLGLPTAYMLATRQFRGKVLVESIIDVPMALPPVVCGVAVLFALSPTSPLGAFVTARGIPVLFHPIGIILVQTFIAAPYLVRHAREAFASVPNRYLQAARVAGASEGRVFFRVCIPLCLRQIGAGALTAWARAIGEFGATLLIVGAMPFKTQTMAISLYVNGFMAAKKDVMFFMAFLFVILSIAVMALLKLLTSNSRSAHEQEA
ncbi:MAG: molybdate ABC transporter permease subunit [Candidatus Wallbacteria bacterium HGW-Wallbacteria-1]|jgi:molybdate transport system permease protein|uniref:Molybdate ABC transporter permease subunit n=1 Tax=Candidatus Wallbacteria bacterium HGW-Wallbacteria-1 TaxID=2013854 RepID=A0A2N1PQ07_9BACT|nr:MAG: molybdate ABC transporter permease subunit [Candidatus Wallbacteria bacterium HGW-Wallbacteria-1]